MENSHPGTPIQIGYRGRGELTARERELMVLVASGLSDKQAADRLGTSSSTIHNHMGNILRKLECPNRTAAAVIFTLEYIRREGS